MLYAAVLVFWAGRIPFWVDEILQLLGTRDASLRDLIGWVQRNPGAVPVGYLTQRLTIDILGYSVLAARLPSIIFGLLGCINIYLLARRLRLKYSLLPLILFAGFPLQFRYSLEARPYSEALFFSSLATLLFLQILQKPRIWSAIIYALVVIAGLYTQPYTILTQAGTALWMLTTCYWKRRRFPVFLITALCLGVAVVAFLPWYLSANPHWEQARAVTSQHTRISIAAIRELFHDLVGGGLICSGIVIATSAMAVLWRDRLGNAYRPLLVFSILSAVVGALVLDSVARYFFASRQLVFVLPSLAILASSGLESLFSRHSKAALLLGLTLLGACLFADWRYLTRHQEDWELAAARLRLRQNDACIVFLRASEEHGALGEASASDLFLNSWSGAKSDEAMIQYSTAAMYVFFEPSLKAAQCHGFIEEHHIVSVASPYVDAQLKAQTQKWFIAHGFRMIMTENVGPAT